jgi:hypothetical protein
MLGLSTPKASADGGARTAPPLDDEELLSLPAGSRSLPVCAGEQLHGSQLSRYADESSSENCRPSCPRQTFAANASG